MKLHYTVILLCSFVALAIAQPPAVPTKITTPVTPLKWDHPDIAAPDMPITFRVYAAPITKPEAWVLLKGDITTKETTVTFAGPGHWRMYSTAVAGGLESNPSAVQDVKIYPTPPGVSVRVAVQTSTDLKNWQDAAFAYSGGAGEKLFIRSTMAWGDEMKALETQEVGPPAPITVPITVFQ